MDQNKIDEYIAKMTVQSTYKSRDTNNAGIILTTEVAKMLPGDARDVLDKFKLNLADRLKLPLSPAERADMAGFYEGVSAQKGTISLTPYATKVTEQELKIAVDAEINEAKARVAARGVQRVGALCASDEPEVTGPIVARASGSRQVT